MKWSFSFFFSILLVVICFQSCFLAAGSYPYAKTYALNINEESVIAAIEQFREENPQFLVPQKVMLTEGRSEPKDHWYHLYFYYPKENEILYCWARQTKGKEQTTFAFVSVNDGLALGNWKDINHDYNRKENKRQLDKFEKTILAGVKLKLPTR